VEAFFDNPSGCPDLLKTFEVFSSPEIDFPVVVFLVFSLRRLFKAPAK
jgi:hypothetical protein